MLLGDGIWPTTEYVQVTCTHVQHHTDSAFNTHRREMKSNTWHLFAEEMLDRGITLLDKDGRAWRRRLR